MTVRYAIIGSGRPGPAAGYDVAPSGRRAGLTFAASDRSAADGAMRRVGRSLVEDAVLVENHGDRRSCDQ